LCVNKCTATTECAPGNSCDTSTATCLGAQGGTEDDSGCAMGHGAGSATPFALLGLAALASRRRRVRTS
jgi:MYXO-CTERM domain-containing protein